MNSFFRWLVKENLFGKVLICNLVHDESCIEYPETMPEVSQILKEKMEESAAKYCKHLPIPAAPEVGRWWLH